jgi:ATP synthase protein I
MSSRTENDDPWLRLLLRTAGCGPRHVLPAARGIGPAGVSTRMRQDITDRGKQQPPEPELPAAHERDGWQMLSYMLGGMIFYGAVGWLVGHWTGITILFPLGMILGIGLSVALIAFRVTRS